MVSARSRRLLSPLLLLGILDLGHCTRRPDRVEVPVDLLQQYGL